MRRAFIASGILCIMFSGLSPAQTPVLQCCAIGDKSALTFLANVDSAVVLIDGTVVGRTPVTVDTLSPGKHAIRLVHPEISNWLVNTIADTITLGPNETRTLRYAFEPGYVVTSSPFDAEVFLGDSLLGTTPVRLSSGFSSLLPPSSGASTLRIRKSGYEPADVQLAQARHGILAVDLKKKWDNGLEPDPVYRDTEHKGQSHFHLYLSGAATVVSGVAAAYFKTRADDRFALYGQTGNPSLLSETHRLDAASAVALVITQVSFALFTYFILSE